MASEAKPYDPELFDWIKRQTSEGKVENVYETDITLRDLFATVTMHGLYVSGSVEKNTHTFDNVAHAAYEMADAMLVAREKSP